MASSSQNDFFRFWRFRSENMATLASSVSMMNLSVESANPKFFLICSAQRSFVFLTQLFIRLSISSSCLFLNSRKTSHQIRIALRKHLHFFVNLISVPKRSSSSNFKRISFLLRLYQSSSERGIVNDIPKVLPSCQRFTRAIADCN